MAGGERPVKLPGRSPSQHLCRGGTSSDFEGGYSPVPQLRGASLGCVSRGARAVRCVLGVRSPDHPMTSSAGPATRTPQTCPQTSLFAPQSQGRGPGGSPAPQPLPAAAKPRESLLMETERQCAEALGWQPCSPTVPRWWCLPCPSRPACLGVRDPVPCARRGTPFRVSCRPVRGPGGQLSAASDLPSPGLGSRGGGCGGVEGWWRPLSGSCADVPG